MSKSKKTFLVDVYWKVFKQYEVEADNADDAKKQIDKMIDKGDVCVWTDGFETVDWTSDEVQVETVGEMKNGKKDYYI